MKIIQMLIIIETEFDEQKNLIIFILNKKIALGNHLLIINYQGIRSCK